MDIVFTEEALDDLSVLHDFLQNNDVINAQDIIESLVLGIAKLKDHPHMGSVVQRPNQTNKTRDFFIKRYCVRYLIDHHTIYILRFWYQSENASSH